MEAGKPPGVCRIFIFGESAAMGDPEPAYGAGRYLEVLLRERFPGRKFEVINLGITAINSHVIVPIARECARREGDIWIIYMGNNEMVGPFGAATVFGAQAPPLEFVRLNLALQQTRVGQMLVALGRKLRHKSSAGTSWGGMQMFVENRVAPGDPRKEVVYRNFERNLRDIVRAGAGSGAKFILSTVAVDLEDCPPFASMPAGNSPAADRAAAEKLCHDGLAAEAEGRPAEAAQQFEAAAKLEPQSADCQFHLGKCLLLLTNAAGAREHFQSACDLDALPFRADSRINQTITDVARQLASPGLALFDAVAALQSNNPAAICGGETFYEHVHFNFDGSYHLARGWAGLVEKLLPAAFAGNPAQAGWASQEICERRLGLTDWNRCAVFESVVKRLAEPPLSSQFNNDQRREALVGRVRALRQRMNPAAEPQARAIYREAMSHAPDDYYLHENFAAFLVARGELDAGTAEWQRAHELVPQDFIADYRLGEVLARKGRLPEAEAILREAVSAHPGMTEGWKELGDAHSLRPDASAEELGHALEDYERARTLRPQDPEIRRSLGKVLARLKRPAESIQQFREAVRLKPDDWEAHYLLGGELGYDEQITAAAGEFREVIRLRPDFAPGHLNLGVALLKQGQADDARREFEATLRLDPANQTARNYLAQAQAMRK